jgi:hypothetical protein
VGRSSVAASRAGEEQCRCLRVEEEEKQRHRPPLQIGARRHRDSACRSSSGGLSPCPTTAELTGPLLPTDGSAPTRHHARASRRPRRAPAQPRRACAGCRPKGHAIVRALAALGLAVAHAVAVGPGRAPARPRRARGGRRPRAHAAVRAIAAHAQAAGLLRAPARRALAHHCSRRPPACFACACTPRALAACCRVPHAVVHAIAAHALAAGLLRVCLHTARPGSLLPRTAVVRSANSASILKTSDSSALKTWDCRVLCTKNLDTEEKNPVHDWSNLWLDPRENFCNGKSSFLVLCPMLKKLR